MGNIFPFQKIWFGVDLGEIRPINSTYGGEPFDLLLSTDTKYLDGTFSHLSNEIIE